MHACWPTTAVGHIKESFTRGERAPHRAIEGLKTIVLERSEMRAYLDVDTPEEFEKAKRIFKERNEKK